MLFLKEDAICISKKANSNDFFKEFYSFIPQLFETCVYWESTLQILRVNFSKVNEWLSLYTVNVTLLSEWAGETGESEYN